ncbi:synaptic plasticity regulator PANTS isoform X2 [Mustelus asterias]
MADGEIWRPPRVCDDYRSEWKHCRSLGNLFHHYYTYGELPSCQQWKKDYHNCMEWEKLKFDEAKFCWCQGFRKIEFRTLQVLSLMNRFSPPTSGPHVSSR